MWPRRSFDTAAKDHRCGECLGLIPKATKYVYLSGVWEGSGFSAKRCQRCDAVAELACRYVRWEPDAVPTIGDLAEWLLESLRDDMTPDSNSKSDIIAAAWPVLRQMVREGKRL